MGRLLLGLCFTMWTIGAMVSAIIFPRLHILITDQHVAVNFARILEAFIIHKDEEGGPPAYFKVQNDFTNMAGVSLYVAQTLLGDAILLGRSTSVWGLRWRVMAFPFLLFMGTMGVYLGLVHIPSTNSAVSVRNRHINLLLTRLSRQHFPNRTGLLAHIFLPSDACHESYMYKYVNHARSSSPLLTSTALIAKKIWTINRFTAAHVIENKMIPVLRIVVESGAIYPCALIALLSSYLTGSSVSYILFDGVSSLH